MKIKHIKLFAVVMLAGLIIAGCKKKGKDDEEELITTVKVILTPVGGGAVQTFTFRDPDGDGGNPATIDSIKLSPSKTYSCALQFLDESKTPVKDITAEIVTEAKDHQVYYKPTGVNITVNNLNTDGNNLALGTTSTWVTTTAGTGTLKITLKHKPGIKKASDDVSVGGTDIEAPFPIKIQ